MVRSIYYLPGHGGRLESGLGSELRGRGFGVFGRETVGEFRSISFSEQVAIIANDLAASCWHEDSLVLANSFGAYLFLNAQALLKPYVGKLLLLSPIVGEFLTEDTRMGFVPPHSGRLFELAEAGTYPSPINCEIHVGERDWQSNPVNVLKLADLLGLNVQLVPNQGHMLDKRYVSAVLDRWLVSFRPDDAAAG
ncbi:MAG: hypothetical protein KBF98_01680 [Rhodoferax sp.]|nr:hypothetical protein [Rhodoferax sp.]